MTQVICYLKKCIHNKDNVCTKDVIMLDDEHFCDGGCDDGWEFAQKEDNDYIRREDVLKGQKTGTFANGICLEAKACVPVDYIESLEPADVIPVVMCKDCKYNTTTHKCLNPDSFFLIPKDDDFCSYGERKK